MAVCPVEIALRFTADHAAPLQDFGTAGDLEARCMVLLFFMLPSTRIAGHVLHIAWANGVPQI